LTERVPFGLDGNPRYMDDPNTDDTGRGKSPFVDMGAYEASGQEGPTTVLDLLTPKKALPRKKMSLLGRGFGETQGTSLVHINGHTFDSDSSKIKLWSATEIQIKIPFRNKDCNWYTDGGGAYRKRKVWVTVGGIDSNKKRIKVLAPPECLP
jgi:hypothetical protein